MTGGFVGTGLAGPLADAADALGWDAPTPLQAAAIPVIRRGGNVVLRGSSGAGVTGAWAAGVLERLPSLEEAPGPRALVLCPTADRAADVADTLARMLALVPGGERGEAWHALRVRALAPGWAAGAEADLLAADAAAAARAVASARLKLEGTAVLVIEDLPALLKDAADGLDTVLAAIPREAQRVFITPAGDGAPDDFIEANARRALTIPPRPKQPAEPPEPTHTVTVVLTREAEKLDTLCALLAGRDAAEDVVLVRSQARVAELASGLERRGFGAAAGGPAVESWIGDARGTIACDAPFDAAGLARLAGDAPVLLATPDERRHLVEIAREAGVGLELRSRRRPRTAIDEWRGRIERALEEEDLDAQIALLQPLLERHAAEEIAAALSALLRQRTPTRPAEPAPRGPAPPDAPPSFVRLFFSIGQRDGLRPADLVGAITGETGLPGAAVGRIDIRDTFTVAEVDTAAADRVIRALNGTTLRGRSLRVDYDRRSTPGAVRRSRPPRPGP